MEISRWQSCCVTQPELRKRIIPHFLHENYLKCFKRNRLRGNICLRGVTAILARETVLLMVNHCAYAFVPSGPVTRGIFFRLSSACVVSQASYNLHYAYRCLKMTHPLPAFCLLGCGSNSCLCSVMELSQK